MAIIIPVLVCAVIGLFAAVRMVVEQETPRKLLYLNVLNFAIAGSVVLLVPDIMGLFAAAAYFVGSTLESNAIASTLAGGVKRA
ncbi:DUF2109 domain-containing protein [Methanovulcanius yangii]|uniref:DUF2109 domain-containing protein n=1 Tax=Methanovulcanius yangii TaxID=1789227 RepID=UPI0029CA8B1F|nr:DUF2109 domain-containing protein [Methanovulcanius yangii]